MSYTIFTSHICVPERTQLVRSSFEWFIFYQIKIKMLWNLRAKKQIHKNKQIKHLSFGWIYMHFYDRMVFKKIYTQYTSFGDRESNFFGVLTSGCKKNTLVYISVLWIQNTWDIPYNVSFNLSNVCSFIFPLFLHDSKFHFKFVKHDLQFVQKSSQMEFFLSFSNSLDLSKVVSFFYMFME